MEGWIKLYRQITENPLYFSEPFTRCHAWIDMLILANTKDGFFFKRGIRVEVIRGQIGYDIESLAKRWKWSRGKVERFFVMLEKDRQIIRQKSNITTLISICNYNVYQSSSNTKDKPNGHQTINQTNTNKNKKKDKEGKENLLQVKDAYIPSPDFIKLQGWMKSYTPTVLKMKTQMTEENLISLKLKYDSTLIAEKLTEMENKADLLKKYNSVYLTLRNWLKPKA